MKTGIELIAQERAEQIEKHGFTSEVDAELYDNGELIDAVYYCLTRLDNQYPARWDNWFKDSVNKKHARLSRKEFEIEMLTIAGAFIAAEIDRLIGK